MPAAWYNPVLYVCYVLHRSGIDNNGTGSQSVLRAKVDLSKAKNVRELWAQLAVAFKSDLLPDRLRANLVYMDREGDWMLFGADQPWALIANGARKLLISPMG